MKVAAVEKAPLDKLPLEKHNVAWFKLAEFVSRREKERALGVYRLLSHSLPSDAFAAQLEGDLLAAFYDKEKALEAYQKAAHLYEKSGQLDHVAHVCEQMLAIKPDDKEFLEQTLKYFERVQNSAKSVYYGRKLAQLNGV